VSDERSKERFERGFADRRKLAHPDFALTVFYPFKQSEPNEGHVGLHWMTDDAVWRASFRSRHDCRVAHTT
jgi:adenine-specific DNA methylase